MEQASTLNQHCRPSATPLAQPQTQIARKSAKHSKTLQIRILQNAKNLFNGNGMKIVHRRLSHSYLAFPNPRSGLKFFSNIINAIKFTTLNDLSKSFDDFPNSVTKSYIIFERKMNRCL
jgi:hypothetical protein